MAFRAAMNRSKIWSRAWSHHHHLAQGSYGIVGANSTTASTAAHNILLFNNNQAAFPLNQTCRHYYLPPPPIIEVVDGIYNEWCAGVIVDVGKLDEVLPSARFAVMMHNEIEDRNVRFKRVVRAYRGRVAGNLYHLTLEGIDENGELNVYYAKVYECIFEKLNQLLMWQLVDDSFSYPYRVSRSIEKIEKDIRQVVDGYEYSFAESCMENHDLPIETMNFEDNGLHDTELFSPFSNGDIGTVDLSDVIPLSNKINYKSVIYYALSALEAYNKKGKELRLSEVLHASREYIDGKVFYFLFLKAIEGGDDSKFFYALLEVSRSKEELINCHMIDELLCPSKENQIISGA